jgi:hypothetical protein
VELEEMSESELHALHEDLHEAKEEALREGDGLGVDRARSLEDAAEDHASDLFAGREAATAGRD